MCSLVGMVKNVSLRYNAKGRFDDVAYFLARDWSEHDQCSNKEIARRLAVCAATVGYWLRAGHPPSQREPRRDPHAKRIEARRRLIKTTIKKRVKVTGTRLTPKRRTVKTRETTRLPFGSTGKTARELKRQHPQLHVSKSTVWRDCKAMGLKAYTQQRGPRLTEDNMRARCTFAKELLGRRPFPTICFSDEKWFDSEDGGRSWQWLSPGEVGLHRQHQRGGPRVMVWACIGPRFRRIVRVPASDNGTGCVKINGAVYGKLIAPALAEMKKRKLTFQQDNAPGHQKITNAGFFREKRIDTLEGWPANSPDLSPIETLWAILARRVCERAPFGEDELWGFVQEEFLAASEDTIQGLLTSFELRLRLCVKNDGGLVANRQLSAASRKAKAA